MLDTKICLSILPSLAKMESAAFLYLWHLNVKTWLMLEKLRKSSGIIRIVGCECSNMKRENFTRTTSRFINSDCCLWWYKQVKTIRSIWMSWVHVNVFYLREKWICMWTKSTWSKRATTRKEKGREREIWMEKMIEKIQFTEIAHIER